MLVLVLVWKRKRSRRSERLRERLDFNACLSSSNFNVAMEVNRTSVSWGRQNAPALLAFVSQKNHSRETSFAF